MGGAGSTPTYDGLPPVEVHAYATKPDRRSRKLKHLLRANHLNHSVMYSRLRFHNHMPHVCRCIHEGSELKDSRH